jgi:LPS O-antigen subunit length determinant protein (WzzB/FepE family)
MDNFDSFNVLKVIFKNFKALIIVVVVAALLSFGASFLLKEKYKSLSVVYPINMYETSEESTTEQLLQYFSSDDVMNQLAKDFDLYQKYGIDTVKEKGGKALFNFMYQENFKVSPTMNQALEITVTDADPAMAQKLNARMIEITNLIIRENKQKTMREYVVNARRIMDADSKELDSLGNKIKEFRKEYNIVDEKSQGKALGKELVAKGGNLGENLNKQAMGLKEKGPEIDIIKGKIKTTLKSMVTMKEQTYKYLLDSQGEINFVLHVSNPSLPDKRCYPVRWIIVTLASLSAALLTMIVILLRGRIKATA